MSSVFKRAEAFCARFGLRVPILLAPMAGACPPSLSIAVAEAGGLGACGALLMQPQEIEAWAAAVRAATRGPFQLNLWIPGPPPVRDPAHEARLEVFLAGWGPAVPPAAGARSAPDFAAQCETFLTIAPPVVSSIMGLYESAFVARLKALKIAWFATVTTVAEARAAEAAGADVLVVQGMEAGGHRGRFDPTKAETEMAGLLALLPAVADAVRLPVVATGGIADARGIAAALLLGASAVQIGTGFLRCPEAGLPTVWADALARTPPEGTMVTRAFSGRSGRSVANAYVRAAADPGAPPPAPFPVQGRLTASMRAAAAKAGDIERMQAWAGQAAALARPEPAAEVVRTLWDGTRALLA